MPLEPRSGRHVPSPGGSAAAGARAHHLPAAPATLRRSMGLDAHAASRRARLGLLAAVVAGLALLVAPAHPAGAAGCTAVMGQATASPAQIAGWFESTGRQPRLDVSVLALATMFVEEGALEGVRGDIAFAQSIVETGYFGFSPSVAPEAHNYSGIGATGGGVKGAPFPEARVGVRAQMQHLRAYADPKLRSAADLHAPLVDPRFGYLVPNARTVPCWEQFGNGIWAADPSGYGAKVLTVNQRIAAFPRPPEPTTTTTTTTTTAPAPVEVAVPEVASVTEPLVELSSGGGADAAAFPTIDDGVRAGPVEAAIVGRPVQATRQGGGAAGNAAVALTGIGLLSICATLWWHGRRFRHSA